jgi:hypothetical protein
MSLKLTIFQNEYLDIKKYLHICHQHLLSLIPSL